MANKLHVSNEVIVDAVRLGAGDAYQQRIPPATAGGIHQTMQALDSYTPAWNEFIEVFLNSVAADIYQAFDFSNPLKSFERAAGNGSWIRESAVELVKARDYSKLGQDVFSGQVPKINVNYHMQNRKDQYDLEINREVLSQAMGYENGLADLINDYLGTMDKSNEVDTYLIERGVIGEYFGHNNADVYNYKVPDIATATDKAAAGQAIANKLTEVQMLLAFPTTASKYVPNGNPAASPRTVLWTTPALAALFKVYVLPYAFHNEGLDLADMSNRLQVIDQWPQGVPAGTQCILADEGWTIFAETKRWTDSIRNPRTGSTIFFANYWGIYSASRLVPVVRFSTDDTTSDSGAAPTYTALSLTYVKNGHGNGAVPSGTGSAASPATVNVDAIRGTDTWVSWQVTGTNQPNQAAIVTVSGNRSSNTFIDNNGKLFVGTDETATSVTVTVTSVYKNTLVKVLTVGIADA